MADRDVKFDVDRIDRIGIPEAILCEGKSPEQIIAGIDQALRAASSVLLTRLDPDLADALSPVGLDYDAQSRTAIAGTWNPPSDDPVVAVVAAGTSDLPVAREAARTLAFGGVASREYPDVGVAGLWRLLEIRDELCTYPVIIAAAGMEGALFSVLGGLVPGSIVALPTSRGYGVCRNGEAALHSALASCAQGIVAVNIDNGFGAACAVRRILNGKNSR